LKKSPFFIPVTALMLLLVCCKSPESTASDQESTITVTDGGASEPDSVGNVRDSASLNTDTTAPGQGSDTAATDLQETYWKLTELMGKPVGPTPADSKEIHIKFRANQKQFEGFGGCNGMGGTYELKAGNRIKISRIISTQIACPQLDTENKLREILEMVDNYSLTTKTLSLNRAKMAPLARFEAVYF
jgi:heat shock protein HslJ